MEARPLRAHERDSIINIEAGRSRLARVNSKLERLKQLKLESYKRPKGSL